MILAAELTPDQRKAIDTKIRTDRTEAEEYPEYFLGHQIFIFAKSLGQALEWQNFVFPTVDTCYQSIAHIVDRYHIAGWQPNTIYKSAIFFVGEYWDNADLWLTPELISFLYLHRDWNTIFASPIVGKKEPKNLIRVIRI